MADTVCFRKRYEEVSKDLESLSRIIESVAEAYHRIQNPMGEELEYWASRILDASNEIQNISKDASRQALKDAQNQIGGILHDLVTIHGK